MAPPGIQVPYNALGITCPDSRRRRFITKEIKERIRLVDKDQKAKLDL
jgi:hypothetical protein